MADLRDLALRQRVLKEVGEVDLSARLFGEAVSLPVALAPVGLTGMYARRGEVQAARAAASRGVPFTLSSVSVCPIEEVQPAMTRPMWFQLYVLRDRGFMKNALERAWAAGVRTLVFTVDMPVPGARYRDRHSGMSGPFAAWRRMLQAVTHPRWAWDVGLRGRPHDLGNVSAYLGHRTLCSRAFSTRRTPARRCASARTASWSPTMAGASSMACCPPPGPCRPSPTRCRAT